MKNKVYFVVAAMMAATAVGNLEARQTMDFRELPPAIRPLITKSPVRQSPARIPDDGRVYATVLREDFSLMEAGTPEKPSPEYIEDANFNIPATYTSTPGWRGRGIMQAGGAVAIGMVENSMSHEIMTGQIELPALDLHRDGGTAYVRFRALTTAPEYEEVSVRWATTDDEGLPVTGEAAIANVFPGGWRDCEVTLENCPENAVIQIWAAAYEIVLDDIEVLQFRPEIDAPKALKWTNYTGESFTANWAPVEGADHYVLNVFWIRRQGSDDQLPDYKYIVRDKEVDGTSYDVSGLDRDRVYYYYVRAVNDRGVKSEESQVVEVLDLTVPDGIAVTDVTNKGFRASWNPVYNAEGYGFQVVLDHTAPEAERYPLLEESFNGVVNSGEVGSPMQNTIGMYDMDSYGMTRAGWVMYEGGVINGALALRNYTSNYGTQYFGELVSPVMSIGESTGEITIEADFATLDAGVRPYVQIAVPGKVNGESTWVLGAGGEVAETIGADWTHVTMKYKVKPGVVRFSFGTTDGGWLYMDNLYITVELPQGARQRSMYHYNEIKENLDTPSYYCFTDDRLQGDAYSFAIFAARQRPGSYMVPVYVTSEWSDFVDVPEPPQGSVAQVAAEGAFAVSAETGAIRIANPDGQTLVVCDLAGRRVATVDSDATLSLPAGLYIVACPATGEAAKALVR